MNSMHPRLPSAKSSFYFLETHPMIRKLLIGLPERDRETRSNTRHCSRLTSSLYCTAILPLKANMQCRVGLLLQFLLVSVNASSASPLHASFPVGGSCCSYSPAHAPCCLLLAVCLEQEELIRAPPDSGRKCRRLTSLMGLT